MWEIANDYNVDFEQLKNLNPQLSSPDMIMPGMKIKIPSDAKPVKKENMKMEKEMVKTPYKDMSPKPLPVIKEDEKEQPKMMNQKPPMHQMPMPKMEPKQPMPQMQMPMMEQDVNQFTTINFSQMQPAPVQKKEMKHQEKMKPMYQQHHQQQPQYMPMVPMCCYPMYPTNQPMHQGVPPMHMEPQMPIPTPMPMPMNKPSYKPSGCGCKGEKPPFHHYPTQNNHMYQEMPEMPNKPAYKFDDDCDDMKDYHHYGSSNKGPNQGYPQMKMNQGYPEMNQMYPEMNQGYPHMKMNQKYPKQRDMNESYDNNYPMPPNFQPFPTAPYRDDKEDEENNE